LIKVRLLGLSKSVLVPNTALLFATGTNLQLYGDMLRRGLIGRLDAGVERPELRTFNKEDPTDVLKRERGRYAVAALTVLRAYLSYGSPVPELKNERSEMIPVQALGGFEQWSRLVRNALIWLDEADPIETIETARAEDPERQRLEAVITQWHEVLEDRSVTARALIEEACMSELTPPPGKPNGITYLHVDFRNALLDVAGERGRVSTRRLGTWLGKNKLKAVGLYRLAPDTVLHGESRCKLQECDTDGNWH